MTSGETLPNLRDLIVTAGLGRVAGDIQRLLAGSLRLKTTPADEARLALGATKLGGLPDLPDGTSWPRLGDVPLGFIAQICLDDLRGYPLDHALPNTGWLHVFYDGRQQAFGDKPGDRSGWQVSYVPGEASATLKRQAAPDGLPAESRFKASGVAWALEWTLPQRPAIFHPQLDWKPDEQSQYEDFIFKNFSARSGPRHRLLGHADELQDDMHLQCQLLSHGVSDEQDPRAAELAAGALNWQLLLQVDSDANAGMAWGNSGMLYFWIEKDALHSRRFDRVWMAQQSE